MDEQQKQNINQASEQLTDSTQQAFRTLADRTVASQESNLRLTQNFFQNWMEQVQQPGPGHPRGHAEPPGAGPAPAGGLRDALPGGDQRLLRVPKLGVVVLPGDVEHGHAGRPAEHRSRGHRLPSRPCRRRVQAASQGSQQAMEAVSQAGSRALRRSARPASRGRRLPTSPPGEGSRGAGRAARGAARKASRARRAPTGPLSSRVRRAESRSLGKVLHQRLRG